MAALCQLVPKLLRRIDRGVDLAPQGLLGRIQGSNDLIETHTPDNHHIYIATYTGGASGHRTVDERHDDALGNLGERGAQHIGQAHGFEHQPLELGVDRAAMVHPIVDLVAPVLPEQNPSASQPAQFARQGSLAKPQEARYLPHVETLIRVAEKQAQYQSPRCPEQRLCQDICTQNGCNCTQNGCNRFVVCSPIHAAALAGPRICGSPVD